MTTNFYFKIAKEIFESQSLCMKKGFEGEQNNNKKSSPQVCLLQVKIRVANTNNLIGYLASISNSLCILHEKIVNSCILVCIHT